MVLLRLISILHHPRIYEYVNYIEPKFAIPIYLLSKGAIEKRFLNTSLWYKGYFR